MKSKIKHLIEIQKRDNRIEGILKIQKEAPLRIQKLQDTLNGMETGLLEDQAKLDAILKEKRNNERETQELDAKIEKSNEKLSMIKSNKEYRAALKEIDDLKHHKFQIEEVTLQVLEQIEEMDLKIKQTKEDIAKSKEQFNLNKADVEAEMNELGKELQALEQERQTLSQSADAEFLKKYRFLRERRSGQGITAVINGVCQTCHLGLPPQKFNELKKCDSLLTCPHCNRIIYWGEDEFFQAAPKEPGTATGV